MTDQVAPVWEAIPGWTDENMRGCYDFLVGEAKNGDVIVEVGSFLGRSLCYLCMKIKEAKKEIAVISVDKFPDEVLVQVPDNKIQCRDPDGSLGIVRANVQQGAFQHYVTFIRGDSAESAGTILNGSVFAVYIDDDHTYEGVLRSVKAWLPKVRSGGWLCGHDYGDPGTAGVKLAVDQICGEKNVKQQGSSFRFHKP